MTKPTERTRCTNCVLAWEFYADVPEPLFMKICSLWRKVVNPGQFACKYHVAYSEIPLDDRKRLIYGLKHMVIYVGDKPLAELWRAFGRSMR